MLTSLSEQQSGGLEFNDEQLGCPLFINADAELYEEASELFPRLIAPLTQIKTDYAKLGMEVKAYTIEKQFTASRALVFSLQALVNTPRAMNQRIHFIFKLTDRQLASGSNKSRVFEDLSQEMDALERIDATCGTTLKLWGIDYPQMYTAILNKEYGYMLISQVAGVEFNYWNAEIEDQISYNRQLTIVLELLAANGIYNVDPNTTNILTTYDELTNKVKISGLIDFGGIALKKQSTKELIPGRTVKVDKFQPPSAGQKHLLVNSPIAGLASWQECTLYIRQLLLANLAYTFIPQKDYAQYRTLTNILDQISEEEFKNANQFIWDCVEKNLTRIYPDMKMDVATDFAQKFCKALSRRHAYNDNAENFTDIISLHDHLTRLINPKLESTASNLPFSLEINNTLDMAGEIETHLQPVFSDIYARYQEFDRQIERLQIVQQFAATRGLVFQVIIDGKTNSGIEFQEELILKYVAESLLSDQHGNLISALEDEIAVLQSLSSERVAHSLQELAVASPSFICSNVEDGIGYVLMSRLEGEILKSRFKELTPLNKLEINQKLLNTLETLAVGNIFYMDPNHNNLLVQLNQNTQQYELTGLIDVGGTGRMDDGQFYQPLCTAKHRLIAFHETGLPTPHTCLLYQRQLMLLEIAYLILGNTRELEELNYVDLTNVFQRIDPANETSFDNSIFTALVQKFPDRGNSELRQFASLFTAAISKRRLDMVSKDYFNDIRELHNLCQHLLSTN